MPEFEGHPLSLVWIDLWAASLEAVCDSYGHLFDQSVAVLHGAGDIDSVGLDRAAGENHAVVLVVGEHTPVDKLPGEQAMRVGWVLLDFRVDGDGPA